MALSLHEGLADLVLEIRHVAAHAVFGAVGVAGEDRAQELHVLPERLAQPDFAVEHEVPEPKAEVEVALESRLEERVARGPVDLPVDQLVEAHELALVEAWSLLESVEELGEYVPIRHR